MHYTDKENIWFHLDKVGDYVVYRIHTYLKHRTGKIIKFCFTKYFKDNRNILSTVEGCERRFEEEIVDRFDAEPLPFNEYEGKAADYRLDLEFREC